MFATPLVFFLRSGGRLRVVRSLACGLALLLTSCGSSLGESSRSEPGPTLGDWASLVAAAATEGECEVWTVTSAHGESPSPRSVVDSSESAVIGTVSHLEAGLFRGAPATLVTVEVDHWLVSRQSAEWAVVRFLFPAGRAVIDESVRCNEAPEGRFPVVGQGVFLGADRALDPHWTVLFPPTAYVLFETREERVDAEGRSASEGTAWDSLEEQLLSNAR